MATRLRKLNLDEITLCRRGASRGARHLLHKADEDAMTPVQKIRTALVNAFAAATRGVRPNGEVLKSEEDQQDFILKEIDTIAEILDTPEPTPVAKEPAVPATAEEIRKSLSPEALALVEKAEADLAEAQRIAKEATDAVAKAAEETAHAARVAKAKELLGTLPGDADTIASILKGLDEKQAAEFERVLKGAGAAAAVGEITTQVGKDGAKSTGTPAAQIEAKAQEIMKSDNVNHAVAVAKVLEQDPSLYEASLTTPTTKE